MVADASAKDQKQLQGKSCGRSPHQRHGICSVCPDVGHLIHVGVLRRLFVSKYVFLIGRFVSGNIGLVSSGRDAVVGDRNGRFTPGCLALMLVLSPSMLSIKTIQLRYIITYEQHL